MTWELHENRIPTRLEVKQLVKVVKERADAARAAHRRQPVIDWTALHCLIASGIRSHELADLHVGDLRLGYGESAIVIRHGKGDRSRIVAVTERLKRHLLDYLRWKKQRGESVDQDAPLLLSERKRPFCTRAIRYLFKRCLRRAGLATHYGVHSLRHFHLTELYAATKDLRLTQIQAGHASPSTTCIYTTVDLATRQKAVEHLF